MCVCFLVLAAFAQKPRFVTGAPFGGTCPREAVSACVHVRVYVSVCVCVCVCLCVCSQIVGHNKKLRFGHHRVQGVWDRCPQKGHLSQDSCELHLGIIGRIQSVRDRCPQTVDLYPVGPH